MKTAEFGTEANVAFTWKRYNDQHGMDWRIEVVATKEIWPFEELIRPISNSMTSYFLITYHLMSTYSRRG